jgi:hypothetical protein
MKRAILDVCAPDIYIHSWDRLGFDHSDRGDNHLVSTITNRARLQQLYNPKAMIIEPMRYWDTSKYNHRIGYGNRNPQIIFGMFHGIQSANRLKQAQESNTHSTYDVVIRSRADLFFENDLDLKELGLYARGEKGIHFPAFGHYGGEPDQFAFGDSKSMDAYANTIENIPMLFDTGLRLHPETMLKANIERQNIPRYTSSIEYSILRANGVLFKLLRD